MGSAELPDRIQWRIHLNSPPERIFEMLASDAGRARFWAEQTIESGDTILFQFGNGTVFSSKVLLRRRPEQFRLQYFGGSTVQFDLVEDRAGGTDLTMTETNVPAANRAIHLPGWIPVLLSLKAAVDFGIDLRNHDPQRTWDHGFVDV